MKRLLGFLTGLLLLALTGAMLFFAGAVYDASDARRVQPFIMQPNNLSADRLGKPILLHEMSDKSVRERLIRKFVQEYFYVIPNAGNATARTQSGGLLRMMSAPAVWDDWQNGAAIEIRDMAGKKMLRDVTVADEILAAGDYWEVPYELRTWDAANDMSLGSTVTAGVLYLRVAFIKELLDHNQNFDVREYLDDGGDPAGMFKFRVDEVRRQETGDRR